MPTTPERADPNWVCGQITEYRELKPRYETYARVLRDILEQAAGKLAPYAIVQTRAKAIASFAEKIQRKWPAIQDPVHEFTDLCGGRIITFTEMEVQAVCRFLRDRFDVDWTNTVLEGQRQKASEFGYRSEHYIVQFKPDVFPNEEIDITVPAEAFGLKAEIQVRTLLAHAWAGFTHDRVYKGTFKTPDKWVRELAGLSALLEQADDALCRIEEGLQTYEASYGTYMTDEQMAAEMVLLQQVLDCDPDNPAVALRIGKLAMTLEDWPRAVEILEKYVADDREPILRDLGISLCKLHRKAPESAEYRRGQQLLEQACVAPTPDPDAFASLAGTWKDLDKEKARGYYRKAYEVAPTYPYAVSNFLTSEIAHRCDTTPVLLMAPAIDGAMQRCRDQVAVGMNLPWAWYDLGLFNLVLNRPYESLTAYAKAIQLSPKPWFLETSLNTLKRLEDVKDDLVAHDWARRLLLIALAGKYESGSYLPAVREVSSKARALQTPVVILAGSCDAALQVQMDSYADLLSAAFCDFSGTIISGGTTAGIGGLVGALQDQYPSLYTVGHIPQYLPRRVTEDTRYRDMRESPGRDFDPVGPLQVWADIVASGIRPADVKLLGIGGGRIAAAEYRIALALGAQVRIVEGIGREDAKLLGDPDWKDAANLGRLPKDAAEVRTFLAG